MANELAKTYTASDGQEITLNPPIMARWILGGTDNVPESEYAKVIMMCAARKLNPLAGDVAIQPHWNKRKQCNELSVITTKDYFQRRAESNPKYDGKEYGVVVMSGDGSRIIRRDGCAFYPSLGEKLLSGWCRVHVKGHSVPEYAEAPFQEYDTGMSLWSTKPATMIVKVAKSQALREAFPNEFQGVYEPEEMGLNVDEQGEIVEQQDSVQIVSDEGVTRIPVFDDDEQRMAFVEEVAARDVEAPTDYGAGNEYQGWEAF